ncbi:MAG: fuconate dehydratase [Planctomycetes bacterium]|nr:fuconate dehydratase [Planctomycetota bacterium]
MKDPRILAVETLDVRFPTSDALDGSDAVHRDPDYSAAYVILRTDQPGLAGHGLTFTIGRGNELCVAAVHALEHLVVGRSLGEIRRAPAEFWRSLVDDTQLRWVGPEKGVLHLATAALVNAVWDLEARRAKKPLWKLLVDLSPEELVDLVDFRYLAEALTREEALAILSANAPGKAAREREMRERGFPAYTTSAGWLGYSDEKVRGLCRSALREGWRHFKMKVGASAADDLRRAALLRSEIGPDCKLMMDANQRWDVPEAIARMKELARFDPWWIEEPTSPDDVLGHAAIARAIAPIGVATGEMCQNRVIFKQLLQAGAIRFCQIDACRLGGINEVLAVLLLARKFGVPVCPHAGGVGLCEYVNHLVMVDYIAIGASLENRVAEYVSHLHDHFETPAVVRDAHYQLPTAPGYGVELKPASLAEYRFPDGPVWRARRAAPRRVAR